MARAPICEICKKQIHYFSGPSVTIIDEGKKKVFHKICWTNDKA